MTIPSISAQNLKAELASYPPPLLLDVREPEELGIAVLPNVVNIPLHELPERMRELDPTANWVVICRAGVRSAQAVAFLLSQGFEQVRNFDSGMNGWARQIDPTMNEY